MAFNQNTLLMTSVCTKVPLRYHMQRDDFICGVEGFQQDYGTAQWWKRISSRYPINERHSQSERRSAWGRSLRLFIFFCLFVCCCSEQNITAVPHPHNPGMTTWELVGQNTDIEGMCTWRQFFSEFISGTTFTLHIRQKNNNTCPSILMQRYHKAHPTVTAQTVCDCHKL